MRVLIALAACLEPGQDVGVETRCDLVFDRPIEMPARHLGELGLRELRRVAGSIASSGRLARRFSSASVLAWVPAPHEAPVQSSSVS